MKTNLLITALLAFTIQAMVTGQTPANQVDTYSAEYWIAYSNKLNLTDAERNEFLQAKRKASFQKNVSTTLSNITTKPNGNDPNQLQAIGCNNIDFEAGNSTGWTLSSGFHPIFNPNGCCLNPGGQQLVVTGTGVDPFGGFPLVAPGGNFSMRIGNSGTGGEADRIQQTFFVTAANANFTYKYAVVFQDPGHVATEQPAFVVEMFDTTNTAIPCTYYNVAAGQNIPGFLNSNTNGVVYKPWTNVIVDLTNYIGQNVTIRFTTYDCALGGHFGYAYVDGNCAAFQTTLPDTLCVGQSKVLCAPNGFGSYYWVGGNITGQTAQCVTVTTPGNYAVQTTMVTNCQGPTFNYPIQNHPTPNANFNIGNSNNTCNLSVNFNNTSSMSSGSLTSYFWNFGDNTTSTLQQPVHTYSTFGTYTVSLIVGSNKGCYDTTSHVITINPGPTVSFTNQAICLNASVTFSDNSNVTPGNIVSWNWNLGNGNFSTLQNPSSTYTSTGNYLVSLTVTSNQGCIGYGTQTVFVNALPVINFTATSVCLGQSNVFTNQSTVANGSITNYIWNFNGFNSSTATNPFYTFPNSGIFNVQLNAISSFNCISSTIQTVQVYANPVANFNIPNTCANSPLMISNTSSVANGYLNTFIWNFGNNSGATVANPAYSYPSAGTYTINLIVSSNLNCSAFTTKTITIHAVPQVNFSSNIACLNQTTQFNNSTVISNGNITKWRWDFQNDGIWDDTLSVNPNLIYPSYGTHNCKLSATSNNNCTSALVGPVIVRPNPKAEFIANSACLGDATNFVNASSSPYGAITSYQWQYYGDGNVSNVTSNAAHTYSFTGIFLVKLEVQNEFGCVNVLSKPVYVNPNPVANYITSKPKGCDKVCVTFTNQSTISSGKIVTNQWIFGDGSLPGYDVNPVHCYGTGKFDVTLKLVSDSGCITTKKSLAVVEVYPKPIASFVTEPSEIDELEPIVNVTGDAVGADEVTYYLNDGYTYKKNSFAHSFTNLDKQKPIIFQVVTNKYGCADTTSRILKLKQTYAIYVPNTFTPNEDGLNDGFKALGYNIVKFEMRIYDRWGHLIFETNDMNNAWDGHTNNSSEPIKDAVYVWKANVVDINNKAHELVGHVTLLK